MLIFLKNKHTLVVNEFIFKCCVGKKGLTKKKIEGDKKTPIGKFNLGSLYYRKDRIREIKTNIKTIAIKKNMGWCDDVRYPKYYNRLIKRNKNIKHERLYRNDKKYDLLIPIKYNHNKIITGKGSCIFLHLTKNYKPTAGCIAISENDMKILIKILDKKNYIMVN